MLTQLSIRNIKQKKFRNGLAILSVAIGTAALLLFFSLSRGIQTATFQELEKQNPLTQITVRAPSKNTGLISLIPSPDDEKLNDQSISEISQLDHVVNIHPQTQFNNFSAIEASVLGFNIISDTMIFGLPKDFIASDLPNPEIWDKTEEPYPAVIPTQLLNLYNLTIAGPQNLPNLGEDQLLGKELTLFPNYSTFFPGLRKRENRVRLEVVGFSDRVNLIGVSLPSNVVSILNQQFTEQTDDAPQTYLELFVETDNSNNTSSVAQEIEALGYETQYFQKNASELEARFSYLTNSLGVISGIILLTSAIAIMSTFLATISERRRELGLFRALGATKKQIRRLILNEAIIIGLVGSIAGITIGYLTSLILNAFLTKAISSTTTISTTNFFSLSINHLLLTIFFGSALTILTAYIPAHQASNIDPIQSLKK